MHPDLTAGRYNLQLRSIIHHFCLLDKRENGVFEIFFAAARACFLGLLPALPLVCFLSPIPPPALAERSSPPGKGETLGYFMQGASPLASPAFNRLRHLQTFSNMNPAGGLARLVACRPCRHCPRRGAFLLCRLPTLPLACFPAPYPPPALVERSSPVGKGVTKVISCKGLRPLHPRD